MPIYEFYCEPCNTIFNFFSKRINTEARPLCPRCGKVELSRKFSTFATIGRAKEEDDADLPFDADRLERALASMADEVERADDEDPRRMADLVRRLSAEAGLHLGEPVQEALARMEAGEDPESIEQEMGDLLEQEDPFAAEALKRRLRRGGVAAPRHDPELYEL